MDEEKTKVDENATTPTDDNGGKYETTPVIERAREERERMEVENTRREKLLEREEALQARRELGGMSEAGLNAPKVPEKISDVEYSKKLLRGEVNPLKEDGIELY